MELTDLRRGFEYDLWANFLWLDAAPDMPDPKPALDVLDHMAWAQEIWFPRIDPGYVAHEANALQERFQRANSHWRTILREQEPAHIVSYKNSRGEPIERQLGAIAWHVINHGTYHRGHLRGLAGAQNYLQYPETDLLLFFLETDLYGSEK